MQIKRVPLSQYRRYSTDKTFLDKNLDKTLKQKAVKDLIKGNGVEIKISEEGKRLIETEELKEEICYYEDEDPHAYRRTNFMQLEHLDALRDSCKDALNSISKKRGFDSVEEIMYATAEAFEKYYNNIMEQHKDGSDRIVKYEFLAGEQHVTLEDDLNGLNEAFSDYVNQETLPLWIQCLNRTFEFVELGPEVMRRLMGDFLYEKWLKEKAEGPEQPKFDKDVEEKYLDDVINVFWQFKDAFMQEYSINGYNKGTALKLMRHQISLLPDEERARLDDLTDEQKYHLGLPCRYIKEQVDA